MDTTYWIYTYITRINGEISAGLGFDKSNYSHFDFYKFHKLHPKCLIIMTQQVSEEYCKNFYEYVIEERYKNKNKSKERRIDHVKQRRTKKKKRKSC